MEKLAIALLLLTLPCASFAGGGATMMMVGGTAGAVDNGAFVETFNNSSIDSTRFSTSVAGSGTVVEDNTNLTISVSVSDADAAILIYKNKILKETRTFKTDYTITTNTAAKAMMGAFIVDSASIPVVGLVSSFSMVIQFDFNGIDDSYGISYTMDNTTQAWPDAGNMLTNGATYRTRIDTTTTTWRLRVMSTDEGTTYMDSGTINWSGTIAPVNDWYLIIAGDPYTNAWQNGTVVITRFEVQ